MLWACFAAAVAITVDIPRPPASRLLSADSDDGLAPPVCNLTNQQRLCVEQVHLAFGGPGEMVVSWATADDETRPSVVYWGPDSFSRTVNGTAAAYSQLLYVGSELIHPSMGAPWDERAILQMQNTSSWASALSIFPFGQSKSYYEPTTLKTGEFGSYRNPAMIYTSPLICTATLSGLLAGRTYGYRVAGHTRDYSFTMPPDPTSGEGTYPFSVGLTADLGQTRASRANVELLRRRAETVGVGVVLLAGDLSYADGWLPRWDTYGRMMEPLAAAVPVMTTAGNHELGSGEGFVSYNARYPMPHTASGSPTNLWYSIDVGPVHLISLCSYAATAPGSLQHRWLRRDLARIDRSMTPWVIVMMHAPWYNTNSGHKGEAELMRQHMEADLYEAGVDLVLSGHVHAYERTLPVYRGLVDECGPVYLNLGDGGNYEGAYMPWLPSQPSWSAFRQATFGVGLLTIVNQSHAWYNWSRSSCMSANGTGANGDPSLAHINLDAESCMSRSSSRTDNAEDPYANQDGAWIMRSSATRQRCIEQYNATLHGHGDADAQSSGLVNPPAPPSPPPLTPPEVFPAPPGDDIGRLIFVALLALGFGAAIGATSAVFCVRVANKRIIHQRGVMLMDAPTAFARSDHGGHPA
eukprot:jgi/Chrpa1/16095/Chrysochromulina_OHIO_Genome00022750-RA